jgi:hypothetical protein
MVVVATAGATSTGIIGSPDSTSILFLISNANTRKPVVTVGASEKWKTGPAAYVFNRFRIEL